MFSLTMPMAMLMLFSQVFRSVSDSPQFPVGVNYIDFLTPAMLAVSTVMAGTNAGLAAAIDHTHGLHERFRTLPMPPRLPAVARTLSEVIFTLARGTLLIGCAVALGFRFHGALLDALSGIAVVLILSAAMSALFGRLGDHLRRPNVVQFAGMMLMMPFMFVSGAFAPLATMPEWMRALAAFNPVAQVTEALRNDVLGAASPRDTATAIATAVILWVVVTLVPRGAKRPRQARLRSRSPSDGNWRGQICAST
jgi:ABC-2 type transport system permease protein